MENEKLKLWLDFGKFFLGTFLIGFVSLVIKWGFQDREIAIKESQQVGEYVEYALLEDVAVRKRFAEYFKTVLVSDDHRERWEKYFTLVESEYGEKVERRDSLMQLYENLLAMEFQNESAMDTTMVEMPSPVASDSRLQLEKIQQEVQAIDSELRIKATDKSLVKKKANRPSQQEFTDTLQMQSFN